MCGNDIISVTFGQGTRVFIFIEMGYTYNRPLRGSFGIALELAPLDSVIYSKKAFKVENHHNYHNRTLK
jgi:hypothetical protein